MFQWSRSHLIVKTSLDIQTYSDAKTVKAATLYKLLYRHGCLIPKCRYFCHWFRNFQAFPGSRYCKASSQDLQYQPVDDGLDVSSNITRRIAHLLRFMPASQMVWVVSWGIVRIVREKSCLDVSSSCGPACNDYVFDMLTGLWLHDYSELKVLHKWFRHMRHWFASVRIGQCRMHRFDPYQWSMTWGQHLNLWLYACRWYYIA